MKYMQQPAFAQPNTQPLSLAGSGGSDLSGEASKAAFFDRQTGSFFRRTDWAAFWTVWLIAFGVYLYTLAPSVTLEDSGELSVAADYLGVPHPPGYPLWTLLAWFFQWVFHGIQYHGYPNPAWAIGLMSATFSSLASAFLALLVSRSGADMLRGIKSTTELLGFSVESKICWTAGVTAGLLLAFSPVLWSQSVIIEVYALNCFFMIILLLMTYRWMSRPNENTALYALAYLFGLGLTNHHTLFFLSPAFFFALLFRDLKLWRDTVSLGAILLGGLLLYRGFTGDPDGDVFENLLKVVFGFLLLLVPMVMLIGFKSLMTEWRRILIAIGCIALGLSFYLYMPVASEQNPPHNWGNTRTVEGFIHSFTRGQYERITPSDIFGNPQLFKGQIKTYFQSVRTQFTLPTMLFAILPFGFFPLVQKRTLTWFITLLAAFFFVSVMLVVFLNPTLDIQTLFIQRRFLILSHAVYAIWLGYSIIFALTLMEMGLTRLHILKPVRFLGLGLAFLMPLAVLHKNFFDEEQMAIIGGPEQRGHDFGWQFGHWQLEGVNGIRSDLERIYGPRFEEVWANYPTPHYPPPISQDAILFGGTDPGRFVPTYMIFSAHCRPDVYLITQNALADNTYMAVMRDLYGDRIWIPSQADSNRAFQQYMEDIQAGRIPPGADVVVRDGRISVQGVAGVMMINGILCRQIFDHNRDRHPFYVEESYVIHWMYPYLQPHGLILKLNAEPIELTSEMIQNDRKFWNWYTERLLSNPRFHRDIVAQKTFSKLRSAIAGIYVYRREFAEAEHAFKQSVALYHLSPEANFRLADLYVQQRRFEDARVVMGALLRGDPGNDRVRDFYNQIAQMHEFDQRRLAIEGSIQDGGIELAALIELIDLYHRLQMQHQFHNVVMNLLHDQSIPVEAYLQVGVILENAQRFDMLQFAMSQYLGRDPGNPAAWIQKAVAEVQLNQTNEALQSLQQAVRLGGAPVRDSLRVDQRFAPLHGNPQFHLLFPQQTAPVRPGFRL